MTADMSADAVEGVEAAAPSEMTGFTQHGLEQAMTRDGGLGVSGFVKRNWPHPARLIWPHPRGQDRDGRPHCVGVRLSAQL